ncbi:hypothetical protein TI05_10090, partial [Achromatium sp. WMS3]
MNQQKIEDIVHKVAQSNGKIIFLAGAGISAESGRLRIGSSNCFQVRWPYATVNQPENMLVSTANAITLVPNIQVLATNRLHNIPLNTHT